MYPGGLKNKIVGMNFETHAPGICLGNVALWKQKPKPLHVDQNINMSLNIVAT